VQELIKELSDGVWLAGMGIEKRVVEEYRIETIVDDCSHSALLIFDSARAMNISHKTHYVASVRIPVGDAIAS